MLEAEADDAEDAEQEDEAADGVAGVPAGRPREVEIGEIEVSVAQVRDGKEAETETRSGTRWSFVAAAIGAA